MMKGAEEPRVTTLPSGLRIVSQSMAGMRTVAAGVWVRTGSRDKSPAEHGLAHFLEHMAFKGTRKRSALRIVEEMEAVGGDLNAATNVETTAYYVRLMGEHLPVALDIFADILANSTFDEQELRREKGVVLQEIGACEDSPEDWLPDLFNERAFAGQAIGRQILGTRQSVRGFDGAALRAYLGRRYHEPAMVVAAAGDVDHERLVADAARLFGGFPDSAPETPERGVYVGGETRKQRKLEQVHLMFGFAGRSFNDPAHYAAHAFAHILGGGMSSRLFQEVRERRGLAYTIDAEHMPYSDCGVFSVSAGASEEDAAELINVSLDEIARATEDIDQAELDRARAQMKVGLMSGFESPSRRVDQLASQLLAYDRLLGSDEIIQRLDAITVEDVRSAGRTMLATPPTISVIGPAKTVPHIDAIAARVGAPLPAAA